VHDKGTWGSNAQGSAAGVKSPPTPDRTPESQSATIPPSAVVCGLSVDPSPTDVTRGRLIGGLGGPPTVNGSFAWTWDEQIRAGGIAHLRAGLEHGGAATRRVMR
jgi:hypothetical protein